MKNSGQHINVVFTFTFYSSKRFMKLNFIILIFVLSVTIFDIYSFMFEIYISSVLNCLLKLEWIESYLEFNLIFQAYDNSLVHNCIDFSCLNLIFSIRLNKGFISKYQEPEGYILLTWKVKWEQFTLVDWTKGLAISIRLLNMTVNWRRPEGTLDETLWILTIKIRIYQFKSVYNFFICLEDSYQVDLIVLFIS